MRREPTIGTADITINTDNEPYITEDFANIDVSDPREPILGISFAPVAPVVTPDANAEASPESGNTPVAEQNNSKAAPLQP